MDFFTNAEIWTWVMDLYSYSLTRIITLGIILYVATYLIRRSIQSFFKRTDFIDEKKEKTLQSMLNSTISYTATFGFIIYTVGQLFSIDVGSVLAGAGVLGIIIGLGAQSIVRDLLSGIFFLYENQLHKGDFIAVNDKFYGTVEEIGLRFLKVREWSGKLLTISNGQVTSIQNYNIDHMRVIEKVTVSFSENPKRIFSVLEEICDTLNEQLDGYLKKDLAGNPVQAFQVYGMSSLNQEHRGYEYTIIGLTEDLVYWTASKESKRIIAQRMYDEGIQMSLQHLDIPPRSVQHDEA
ncbi:mechanosensitive ion channel family protein [Pontibacillus salicampi]|uniref:Mechanosensitive ion channel family protein n=1 Tax=Pontibacillus salicampi TaxID=1449801 RepID=A0ABV6LIA0_9BACI